MLYVTRREVLKGLSAVGLAGAFTASLPRLVFAEPQAGGPVLVVIHLRGGCDGLNLISPATDANFVTARASDLRVAADGSGAGFALANGPAADIDFRLHAAAGGLSELYDSGDMAFIHACGLTDSTRSHFVATDMIERGVGNEKDLARSETGWLARAFALPRPASTEVKAVSVSGNVSHDLDGLDNVLAVPNLNGGLPFVGGPNVSSVIWSMYVNSNSEVGEAGRLALSLPIVIDQKVVRDAQGHVPNYQPENGANYDTAGGLAGPLKTVAELIKMDIGLRAITVDYGNWDTHEYQAGRFHGLVEQLSNGLAAFWNDMVNYHNRITVVTISEFGRRLRSNKSGGTDHGRAGVMSVLGGGVAGKKFYGKWPGLNSAQLEEGVDLAVTTDYRQVLSEVLNHVEGKTDAAWFPNYNYPGPLGIF